MTFRISDKVVCVDDSPSLIDGSPLLIKHGVIYVVAEVFPCFDGSPVCNLIGVPIEYNAFGVKCGYCTSRFRLLSDIQAENAASREELIPAKGGAL